MANMNRKYGYGKMSRTFLEGWVEDRAEESLKELSSRAYEYMKEEVPKDTGALRDAIRKRKVSNLKWSVYVSGKQLASDHRNKSHVDYSYIVWKGHKAYTINAKDKPMVWIGKDGKKHGAWRVNIPAQKPNDFVGRALKRARKG